MEDHQKLNLALLIDDDDVVNVLNTIMVRQTGCVESVLSIQSAEKALETLSAFQREKKWPSLIFVDINMPGMDGWQFIDQFRESFSTHKQKCIICMLSSSLDPRDKQKAAQSDMVDHYASKPLSKEVVHTVWKKYVDFRDDLT
ncbi:response regulator [Chryseolinea soli]|nr:response regulator [Chryseolinea soli]